MEKISAPSPEVKAAAWGKFSTCQNNAESVPAANGRPKPVAPRLASDPNPSAASYKLAPRRRFPSSHSEKKATALLRANWSEAGEQVLVRFPGQSMEVELSCGGQVLCSGTWPCEVWRNGELAPLTTAWESTCWVADEDVDYLELEIQLAQGLRVQRHVVLARQDRFLLLADAVLGDQPGPLEYRACLPLGPGTSFRGAKEGREGFLVAARKRRALVLPLALPEWRADERVGELVSTSHGLELHQSAAGRRLFAPLFFDLSPRRLSRRLTWRQLTIGESLAIQPPDVAVGYRIAIGKEQWLLYRSLAPKGNRTLLGHNLSTETLVARFDRKGEVESIIEIE
jgi:hypothetical protein